MTNDETVDTLEHDIVGSATSVGASYCEADDLLHCRARSKAISWLALAAGQTTSSDFGADLTARRMNVIPSSFVIPLTAIRHSSLS